jgi:F-type H+-transporting ATPase subunit alpha
VIWAAQNGYVSDVAVERVKEFQSKFTDFLSTRKANLLERITREKALNNDLIAALKAASEEFKQAWK